MDGLGQAFLEMALGKDVKGSIDYILRCISSAESVGDLLLEQGKITPEHRQTLAEKSRAAVAHLAELAVDASLWKMNEE